MIQTFSWSDLYIIPLMAVVEQVLSADNAVVLSVLIQPLKEEEKKKALFLGIFASIFLRALMIIGAAYLIYLFWVQILGGLYLLYLSIIHIIKKQDSKPIKKPTSLGWTIVKIELVDLLFAIDSVLAAFGLVAFMYPPEVTSSKLWIVYLGGMLGMAMLRFTTLGFNNLINRLPWLLKIAFIGIGAIGVKLIYNGLALIIP